jgi:hypothetical protein
MSLCSARLTSAGSSKPTSLITTRFLFQRGPDSPVAEQRRPNPSTHPAVRADHFSTRPRWPAPSILSDVVSGRDSRRDPDWQARIAELQAALGVNDHARALMRAMELCEAVAGKPYPPPLLGAVTRISVSRPRQAAHVSGRMPTTGLSAPRAAMSTGMGTWKKRRQGVGNSH